MSKIEYKDLLDAGVHFGHLTRKWNPKMAKFIFMEKNGIHIIDLNKTISCFDEALVALKNIVKSGRKVMFVATKKQAKEVVSQTAADLRMPFVVERWLGGMLTNFQTVRKSLKKMSTIDKMEKDPAYLALSKRERLTITRERAKLERLLGGIKDLTRLPAALFVVDVKREHIAVTEAKKLGIPVFAIVDTNSDPDVADYPIPANDDAYKSIELLIKAVGETINEGLTERKAAREEEKAKAESEAGEKKVNEAKKDEKSAEATK